MFEPIIGGIYNVGTDLPERRKAQSSVIKNILNLRIYNVPQFLFGIVLICDTGGCFLSKQQ